MEYLDALNMAYGIILLLFGFILRQVIWGSIKDIQEKHEAHDQKLDRKIEEIGKRIELAEKLVIGEYVTRAEFNGFVKSVSDKLDRIILELGEKQDR